MDKALAKLSQRGLRELFVQLTNVERGRFASRREAFYQIGRLVEEKAVTRGEVTKKAKQLAPHFPHRATTNRWGTYA